MNEDALAAVVAAATLLCARGEQPFPVDGATRWVLAARLHSPGVQAARAIARAHSRWAMSGRLRE